MKINTKQYITNQNTINKLQPSQLKSIKQSILVDKVELSERAQEQRSLRQSITNAVVQAESYFTTAKLSEVKAKIQNDEFNLDLDALSVAMIQTLEVIKGK